MPDYSLFDVVKLPNGVPDEGVPPGARATIIDVYDPPGSAYEVEVVDSEGRTLWWGSVTIGEIEAS